MSIEKELFDRSESKCELCGSTMDLSVYVVPPKRGNRADECALLCGVCQTQLEDPATAVAAHWRCLNDSMWASVPAIQVLAWRMLHNLSEEGWAQDLLSMLYLDEATQSWAEISAGSDSDMAGKPVDSNGQILAAGDNVTLTKDLDVKGAGFTAKRGTSVRGISLVAENSEQIEGKVNGQQIVILTKFVRLSK